MVEPVPRSNLTLIELNLYCRAFHAIRRIRRENGLQGLVAHNDLTLRQALRVLQVIIGTGSERFSREGQETIYAHITWFHNNIDIGDLME